MTVREATFSICPGCGKIFALKGLGSHVHSVPGKPCLHAYKLAKEADTIQLVRVPAMPGKTAAEVRQLAQEKADDLLKKANIRPTKAPSELSSERWETEWAVEDVVEILEWNSILSETETEALARFVVAMMNKIEDAAEKYGWEDDFADEDRVPAMKEALAEHIKKGDPVDVAIFACFLHYHGAKTS